MKMKVEELTDQAFAPFGNVLGRPSLEEPTISDEVADVWLGFSDLMGIGASNAKDVTYLKIHSNPDKYNQIERHLTSAEAFIPLEGRSILIVVPAGEPDMSQCKAFLMDGSKGVLLKKGTWHAVPYLLTEYASYLVLVDDSILEKDDIDKVSTEEVEFDFNDIA